MRWSEKPEIQVRILSMSQIYKNMYNYKILCFGHNLNKNLELVERLYGIGFETNIDDHFIYFPYNGSSSTVPIIFGLIITTDDDGDYIQIIRNFNENEYLEKYNNFITELKSEITLDIDYIDNMDDYGDYGVKDILQKLLIFIDNNKPELYIVKATT